MIFNNRAVGNLSVSIVTLGVLLGSSVVMPTWAMKEEEDIKFSDFSERSFGKKVIKTPIFIYDFGYVEKANKIVENADFLPEESKEFFKAAAQSYNRTQFLWLTDPLAPKETMDDFLFTIYCKRWYTDKNFFEELCRHNKELQNTKDLFINQARDLIFPYIGNIKYMIEKKGEVSADLFDAFFCDIGGVFGKPKRQEKLDPFLKELEKSGFLQNVNLNVFFSLKELYSPTNQLKKFNETTNAQKPSMLVIGEGHKGLRGMESISCYKKDTLTIDSWAHQNADIISDINSPELLEELQKQFEGTFSFIHDTTNMNFDNLYKPVQLDTFGYLVSLLKVGGQFKWKYFAPDLEVINQLTQKHSLKAVFDKKDPQILLFLEKI